MNSESLSSKQHAGESSMMLSTTERGRGVFGFGSGQERGWAGVSG